MICLRWMKWDYKFLVKTMHALATEMKPVDRGKEK